MISTRTMLMRLLSIRTMPNDVAKHKTIQIRVLSTKTMADEVAKHMNNAHETAKHNVQ